MAFTPYSAAPGMIRDWPSGMLEPCGGPSGLSTCLFVTLCAPCAAGDVAAAAGRSYACSCGVAVFLPICVPGVLAQDREALAKQHGIADSLGCLGACLLFAAGCGLCLLCQEVALLKTTGYYASRTGGTYVAAAALSPPQQQFMYAAPSAEFSRLDNPY